MHGNTYRDGSYDANNFNKDVNYLYENYNCMLHSVISSQVKDLTNVSSFYLISLFTFSYTNPNFTGISNNKLREEQT